MWQYFSKNENAKSRFVNLAPTDKADEDGIYFDALNSAITDPDVFNIALTGPYGSGKSSVIKSFLTKYKKPALQISLASFLPDTEGSEGTISKQEIERSILQQMLYGADANKLPLSRFKRIQSPKWWSWAISLFIVLGGIAIWYLFQHSSEISSGKFFKPFAWSNWFNWTCFAFGFLFVWSILHHIYIKSFGVSLKSISLKDVEISPEAAEEESILNRHLDEIIYFFQSTEYELVIIEDLDRFENSEIFVTLREINGLINANAGVKQQIRFLYALRDDMFVNTDRTKFFEFIVPVIPIINHSNAIDKVLEQGKRLAIDEGLNPQFLRDVSRYLNDLRLIQNIFNEYAIYVANLETDEESVLDPNKLLAVLIYKNVLPRDFEQLHRQNGVLAEILGRYEEYISNSEAIWRSEIGEIEALISEAEKQVPRDLDELRKIYAMALVELVPTGFSSLECGGKRIQVHDLAKENELKLLLADGSAWCWSIQNQRRQINFSTLENEIDPSATFAQRCQKVEGKHADFKADALKRIRVLKSKIAGIRTEKFNEIIRRSAKQTKDCFEKLGQNQELLKFLIYEGYLDDTYYQYTSLFHSGRLSPNDNKFLIQIRSFNIPDPDFQIDNPSEVIEAMREEDFGQAYILNRNLIDYLFADVNKNKSRVSKAVDYITNNFDLCDAFFSSYYASGSQISSLLRSLTKKKRGFVSECLQSKESSLHVAHLLAAHSSTELCENLNEDEALSDFLNSGLAEVLNHNSDFEIGKLTALRCQVSEVASISAYGSAVKFVVENTLYSISKENIRFILEEFYQIDGLDVLDTQHYTKLRETDDDVLCGYVEQNFAQYLEGVLLKSENNSKETVQTIISVLNHDEVSSDSREQFLVQQDAVFETFEGVPNAFRTAIIQRIKIEPTWENVLEYRDCDGFNHEALSHFMQDDEVKEALWKQEYEHSDQTVRLSRFMLKNDLFSAVEFRRYVQKIPTHFKNFPKDCSDARKKILIEEHIVRLNSETFDSVSSNSELQASLLAQSIELYLGKKSEFAIDDEVRRLLLDHQLSDAKKLPIIQDIDVESIEGDIGLAAKVGAVFHRQGVGAEGLDNRVIKATIINSQPTKTQIDLFNRYHEKLSDEEVHSVIEGLPSPFSDIAIFSKMPKISNTQENMSFAEWLEKRGLISSFRTTYTEREIRINTFRKSRFTETLES